MARFVERPQLFPGRCLHCPHSAAEFGPYCDTEFDLGELGREYYCASCYATLILPGEVVSRKVYLEALREKGLAEERAAAAGQELGKVPDLEATIIRQQGELEGARGQIVSLQHTVKEKERAAARERKEALLAGVAKQTTTRWPAAS